MEYKALKKGWLPYNIAFEKYINEGDFSRFIKKVPEEYKEKIGRIWFVNSVWFKAYEEGRVKQEYIIKED